MPSFEHKQLIDQIAALGSHPSERDEFLNWIKEGAHLDFLKGNASSDEIVVYGAGDYCFIHALVVAETLLETPDKDDLLAWNCNCANFRIHPREFLKHFSGGCRIAR